MIDERTNCAEELESAESALARVTSALNPESTRLSIVLVAGSESIRGGSERGAVGEVISGTEQLHVSKRGNQASTDLL